MDSNDTIIRFLPVLMVEDDLSINGENTNRMNRGGRRIKVRLTPEDGNIKNDVDLPWCFPLMPKHFHITPQVNEMVMVILQNSQGGFSNRQFIGPIVSQDYFLSQSPNYNAMSLLEGISTTPLPHYANNANNDGTYPTQDDVAVQGRGNSALWLRKHEARLMCGFKKDPFLRKLRENTDPGTLEFNRQGLAYIQMKFGDYVSKKGTTYHSIANIVADKINLISDCEKGGVNLEVNDQNELITQEQQDNFEKNGQRMVYGDSLIAFLSRFRDIFAKHTHHHYNDPQVKLSADNAEFWEKDLNDILCDGIKIK